MPNYSPPAHPAIAREPRNSLRHLLWLSTVEGVFAQIYFSLQGAGSIFLTAFAQALGASRWDFAILAASGQVALLVSPLGVLVTRRLTRRRPAVVWLAGLSRGMSLLFGLLPFVFDLHTALQVFLVLLLVAFMLQNMAGNAWMGMMADAVPLRVRGRFFAARTRVLMIAGFLAGLLAGVAMDAFPIPDEGGVPPGDPALFAFAVLFVIGGSIAMTGLAILGRQPERVKAVEQDSFASMLREPFRHSNFNRLLFFSLWWAAAVGVAASFWGPFMLKNLSMSMVQIQLYGVVSTVAGIATISLWGRFIDRYGNKPAMRLAICMGFCNPLVWVFVTPDTWWIIYIEAATSGVMWAGANLVTTNFVLAIAPRKHQQVYSGVLGALAAVPMIATTLAGAWQAPPPLEFLGFFLQGEQVMFLYAAFARLSAQIPLTFVFEPRSVSLRIAMLRVAANFALRFRGKVVMPVVLGSTTAGVITAPPREGVSPPERDPDDSGAPRKDTDEP